MRSAPQQRTGPSRSVTDLSEEVRLPGVTAVARARQPLPAPVRPRRCEVLVLSDGALCFAVGDLDDLQAALLRRRARAGDGPALLLEGLAGLADEPLRAVVGILRHADEGALLLHARSPLAGPLLLLPAGSAGSAGQDAGPVGTQVEAEAAPGAQVSTRLPAGALVLAVAAEPARQRELALEALAAGTSPGDDAALCDALLDAVGPVPAALLVLRLEGRASPDRVDAPAGAPSGAPSGAPAGAPLGAPAGTRAGALDDRPAAWGPDPLDALTLLHDPETGLPGPALALDRLRQAVRGLDRESCGVLLLGVVLPGRAALVAEALAQRLARAVRPGDTVARWAPDVLLAVCARVQDRHDAEQVVERTRALARGLLGEAGDPRLAGVVLWDPLPQEELLDLPDRVTWLARSSAASGAVLELSATV